MALTKCADCGGIVSTGAVACPHCGAPHRAESSGISGVLMSLFRILMLVLAMVSAIIALVASAAPPWSYILWIAAIVFLVLGIVVKRLV